MRETNYIVQNATASSLIIIDELGRGNIGCATHDYYFGSGFVWITYNMSCLGPLAPRGAVGAGHDGLPHQLSPLLPVVCHGLSLCEWYAGPLRDVVNLALFRPAPSSSAFDCSLYRHAPVQRASL